MNPADRSALVRDADYFCREATHRLRALSQLDGPNQLAWRQAAALTHHARQAVRDILERDRARRRKLAA